jgi:hypothetical protein
MHELVYYPPDYGSSKGTPLLPCRPTVKHRSHSLQRKANVCELAGSAARLRSLRRTVLVIVAVAPLVCQIAVAALFEPSVRAQTVPQSASIRNDGLRRGGHTIAGTTSGVNIPQLTAGVHFFGGRLPVC